MSKTVVLCGICSTPTEMTGTRRCNGCWELERRIRTDPERAAMLLARHLELNITPRRSIQDMDVDSVSHLEYDDTFLQCNAKAAVRLLEAAIEGEKHVPR